MAISTDRLVGGEITLRSEGPTIYAQAPEPLIAVRRGLEPYSTALAMAAINDINPDLLPMMRMPDPDRLGVSIVVQTRYNRYHLRRQNPTTARLVEGIDSLGCTTVATVTGFELFGSRRWPKLGVLLEAATVSEEEGAIIERAAELGVPLLREPNSHDGRTTPHLTLVRPNKESGEPMCKDTLKNLGDAKDFIGTRLVLSKFVVDNQAATRPTRHLTYSR